MQTVLFYDLRYFAALTHDVDAAVGHVGHAHALYGEDFGGCVGVDGHVFNTCAGFGIDKLYFLEPEELAFHYHT